ncbi:YebG family protein [Shewanella sediminis HAW-EB3]|uniref:YebG family protein n=1 Tax=Shewanella sediminis (strain HAW-EB3) TaxID=425104 RepID=A8FW72_SHESH|nr:YebG family protein [Shewanella sediminis]ABV37095.1 YebG family protein [Shewanella sediminis HAW-EB3]
MAVITKFVVVREGVEKMTFTSKKEADAYDKMLDIADQLTPFLTESELEIDENTCEKLSFYLAQHKEQLMSLLKGVAPKKEPSPKKTANKAESKK